MDIKLMKLLNKIELEDKYHSYFKEAQLQKLYINESKQKWTFKIAIDSNLPIFLYNHINELTKKAYSQIKDVSIVFIVNNINYDLLNDYYINIINILNKKALQSFEDRQISIVDNIISIEVFNKTEYIKLNKYAVEITENFYKGGFNNDVNIVINEAKREDIKREIKNDIGSNEKQIKVPETTIIFGNEIKGKKNISIKDIIGEIDNVMVEAFIFGVDFFESSKTAFKIITIKISDYTDSMYAKLFVSDKEEFKRLKKKIAVGNWVKIKGYVKNDKYANDLVINIRDIVSIPSKDIIINDEAEEKRVELHTHTHMSQMDGVMGVKDLIKRAKQWGHKAIAITDHNCCQSFPDAFYNANGIKVIYGVEVAMIDDSIDIVKREDEGLLETTTFVVFDVETTGLNATSGDSIIEVGAVKLLNGEIIDTFQELINPGVDVPDIITKITGITNDMVKGKDNEGNVISRFKGWMGNCPLVAHNAKFDMSFLESAYKKYNLGEITNTVVDTLELSRTLDSNYSRHGLAYVVKRYDVPFDEGSRHRGDYDAKATALVFAKMIQKLVNRNIEKISDIKNLISKDDIHKIGSLYHVTLLAQNDVGLKNIFKLVSLLNTKYLYKTPRILRSEIIKNREGILIGSGCSNGEVFTLAKSKSDEEMNNIMQFYDYIEVQPLSVYDPLLQTNDFTDQEKLINHIKKIIKVAKDNNILVVATGDVHHLDEKDKIYREIIINQKVPGGGRHPLCRDNIKNIPSQHFLTTKEMLDSFGFLDEELRNEIVIENSNKVADMIDVVQVIKKELYVPKMANSDKIVTDMVNERAKAIYGDPLPDIVQARVDEELDSIIGNGFDVIYLISQKLVKKSNDDGYIVGSRGSVGSSFAATLMGITEVNPLPPHYVCSQCKQTVFEYLGESLSANYSSGYDLPDKKCDCGSMMIKEGQDMPFATFLGFKGNKVPDIDLNFSGEYQAKAHNYTKELFGETKVFRAGTIGTVADKTAFGYVMGYTEDKGKILRSAERERLAMGCTGIKRTTGQHPGGIIVIPEHMDIFDFTPYQYPAEDTKSPWYTTHFDFHAIDENILKLDILGHDDPTALRMLQDLTGIDINEIPITDEKVISLFSSPKVLGVTEEQIMCETGTLGIPEFGTKFVIDMLTDTRPKTFGGLLKVSGLSHGTDVWLGNAQELVKNNICEFKDVIGCRDDIMVYLIHNGLEPEDSFKIMEIVRKGKQGADPVLWEKLINLMKEKNIPNWYIDSCQKIKYMFPKAHATAYVMMGVRVAWFKVYYPIYHYATYFSVRADDFDIDTMINGYDAIKEKIIEINNKGYEKTNKETNVLEVLQIALEMTARGYKFGEIDLYKADSTRFVVNEDNTLIPSFRTIDGLGEIVAKKIVEEREKGNFISIEELQKRTKLSKTLVDKMRNMGILKGMPESSQLSLFEI